MSRFLAFFVCMLMSLPGFAQEEKPIVPAKDGAELESRIQKILKDHKVPGMTGVVAGPEGVRWMKGVGLADVAADRPVTEDTLFRIGSITKTFVGLAALKLLEEGRLDLQTPVRHLVPEVRFENPWEATDPVRVVHLLEHTTGWDDIHLKEYAHNDPRPATLAEGLAVGPESRTSRWRPGTRFAYCNSGPAVTAAIVEKLTGQRFEDYVQATFLQPLGMASDFFQPAEGRLTRLYKGDGRTTYPYWHIIMRPAGSLNASAKDMGALIRFFLNRGQGLLVPASLDRMETPTSAWSAQGGLRTGYGLHNYSTLDDQGFVWRGHNGGVDGGLSEFSYLPGQVGFFFSINASQGEAFEALTREFQAFATKDLPRPTLPPTQAVSPEVAARYQGWYLPDSPRSQGMAFLERLGNLGRASIQGDTLKVQSPFGPSKTLVSVDDLRFRDPKSNAARLVLMDTPEGPRMVTAGATYAPVSAFRAWTQIVLIGLFLLTFLSVPFFALVWGTRWLLRRMRGVPNLCVRVVPLLATLALGSVIAIVTLSGDDFIIRMGHRTAWSVGLCASTVAFALFSALGLLAALRAKREGMNRWAYWHSLSASVIYVVATAYLMSWGFIGVRMWV